MRSIGWGVLLLLIPMGDVGAADKLKMLVVSSYHREYRWAQQTNTGFCKGLLEFGYLDNQAQADEYTKTDAVESSTAIIKKLWMDTKRKSRVEDMTAATRQITEAAEAFAPDLIFLGDDNAANYIGNHFLDTKIPVVFWGVNNTPVKYGLLDSAEHPGHNVTGVYQSGYYTESLKFLKTLVPKAQTFAILSDDTETGRSHLKAIEALARDGVLPLTLVESVATNKYEEWQQRALALQEQVDAFYVAQYTALKDANGQYIPAEEVAKWYLGHIRIPEATNMEQFVQHGLLSAANDSGENQGHEAVKIAHDILNGAAPATYAARAPARGASMVNRRRAAVLGIVLTPEMGIEQYIEEAQALPDAATVQ